MTRLFTEQIIAEEIDTYIFSGEEAKYLADVLRMRPGETVMLCDGARTDFTSFLLQQVKNQIILKHRSSRS